MRDLTDIINIQRTQIQHFHTLFSQKNLSYVIFKTGKILPPDGCIKRLAGRILFCEPCIIDDQIHPPHPEKFRTPAGAEHRIDYSRDVPVLAVKLQEMLGVVTHPVTGMKKIPLRIELLSPAMRPIQTTSDLPGFWKGSYALVRKEMKARYPKHEWPENPAEALPMLRSIKRKGE